MTSPYRRTTLDGQPLEGADFFDVIAGRKPAPEGMGAEGLVSRPITVAPPGPASIAPIVGPSQGGDRVDNKMKRLLRRVSRRTLRAPGNC